jgi:hypothetical protein
MKYFGWFLIKVGLFLMTMQVLNLSLFPALPEFENKEIYPIIMTIIFGFFSYCYCEVYLPFQKSLYKRIYYENLVQNLEEQKLTVFLINLGRYSVYKKDLDYGKYIEAFQNKKSPQKIKKELMAILKGDK